MSQTLRVLITGQSPRPDIEAQAALEVPGVEIRIAGALDGMSRAEINASTWRCADADILYTTLESAEIVQREGWLPIGAVGQFADPRSDTAVVDHGLPEPPSP
jgi:hypothetical protein